MRTSSGEDITSSSLLRLIKQVGPVDFTFRTPAEIGDLACFLAELCPTPETATVGLIELMANAIEHGVLCIGHATKLHLRRNMSLEDEVDRRLALDKYAGLIAHIEVSLVDDKINFKVSDPGQGFDWHPFENFNHDRAADPCGRGIAIARTMGFESVEFIGCGNQVVAKISLPADKNV